MLIEWKKIKTIEFNKLKLLKMKEIKKELQMNRKKRFSLIHYNNKYKIQKQER